MLGQVRKATDIQQIKLIIFFKNKYGQFFNDPLIMNQYL